MLGDADLSSDSAAWSGHRSAVGRQCSVYAPAYVGADSNPQSVGELCSTVSPDEGWYASLADRMLEQHKYQFWGVDILLAGDKDCHQGSSNDQDQNPSVYSFGWFWQVSDELHIDSVPGIVSWRQ